MTVLEAIGVVVSLAACGLVGWLAAWYADPDHDDLTWTGKRRSEP